MEAVGIRGGPACWAQKDPRKMLSVELSTFSEMTWLHNITYRAWLFSRNSQNEQSVWLMIEPCLTGLDSRLQMESSTGFPRLLACIWATQRPRYQVMSVRLGLSIRHSLTKPTFTRAQYGLPKGTDSRKGLQAHCAPGPELSPPQTAHSSCLTSHYVEGTSLPCPASWDCSQETTDGDEGEFCKIASPELGVQADGDKSAMARDVCYLCQSVHVQTVETE